MVVCTRDPPEEEDRDEKIEEMAVAKKKELYKKFVWNHGSKFSLPGCLPLWREAV